MQPSETHFFKIVPVEDLTAEEYLRVLGEVPEILKPEYRSFVFMYLPTREIGQTYCIPKEVFEDKDIYGQA